MFISLDWISDYVDLSGLDINTVASRMTLATAEVEGVETLHRFVKGVLVGQIVEAEVVKDEPEHKLTKIVVDCGGQKFNSVCGAPNCVLGMKVAFAPVGTTINGGVIKAATVAGYPSQGVCCSAKELGMSKWHEGVLEIPQSIPNGAALIDYIPETDTLIEIDNKSLTHRPDLWGHYGFAREFSAVFGRPLKALPQVDLAQYDNLPEFPVKIDDLENCPCYGCIGFEAPNIPVTPLIMQRRLHAIGQRTMGLLVDVTNYCMFDLGQPTHAFDGDCLNAVRIDTAKVDREFTTLDGQTRKILPEDLLIWNEDKPVALAGVMGGLESEIKPTTKRMLLECANFKAARIRRTSVRLDLRSDAAQRYEKSQPPMNVKVAAGRILHLLQKAGADIVVTTRWSMDGSLDDQFRYIEMPVGRFNALAGIELPHKKISEILESLGFKVQFKNMKSAEPKLRVGIPPFRARKDISIQEDIVEEVLRVFGYDNMEPVMPCVPTHALHVDAPLRTEHKARRLLAVGYGYTEVHNYCWFNEDWIDALKLENHGVTDPSLKPMEFANPSSTKHRFLRTTLMPNLLALVEKNRQFRDAFKLFEIGHIFFDCGPKTCLEKTALAGVAYQTAAAGSLEDLYRSVKGAVEDLGKIWFDKPAEFEIQKKALTSAQWIGDLRPRELAPETLNPLGTKNQSGSKATLYFQPTEKGLLELKERPNSIPKTQLRVLKTVVESKQPLTIGEITSIVKCSVRPVNELRTKGLLVGSNQQPAPQTQPVKQETVQPNSPQLEAAPFPWQQPGAWIAIKIDGKIVGSMGYIEGDLLKTVVSEGGQVVWFELCLDNVDADVFPSLECQPIPVFPGSWADFSLVWPVDAGFGKLDKILSEFTHPLLVSRSFIGCYKGKGMEPGMGSYTFRTQIGAADHTLTGEEIEQFRAAWLDFLKEKGIALRS